MRQRPPRLPKQPSTKGPVIPQPVRTAHTHLWEWRQENRKWFQVPDTTGTLRHIFCEAAEILEISQRVQHPEEKRANGQYVTSRERLQHELLDLTMMLHTFLGAKYDWLVPWHKYPFFRDTKLTAPDDPGDMLATLVSTLWGFQRGGEFAGAQTAAVVGILVIESWLANSHMAYVEQLGYHLDQIKAKRFAQPGSGNSEQPVV